MSEVKTRNVHTPEFKAKVGLEALYGTTSAEAYAEITDEEAEHLLDYVTGPERASVSVLMRRHA